MPVRDDNPGKLLPRRGDVNGCRWELIMPMLLEEQEKAEKSPPGSGTGWDRFGSGVKDVRTGTDPRWGTEFICWKHFGVALMGGPFERQRVAYRRTCPNCGHDAANLCSTASLIQRCCKNCRLDHERAMARNAAKRRRRAKGEVTTPLTKACETCGEMFSVKRSTARFCSTKCRVAAHRSKASAPRQARSMSDTSAVGGSMA